MNKFRYLVAALCFAAAMVVQAQPAASIYTTAPSKTVTVKTFTLQGAATITSADQPGFGVKSVICVLNAASHTGTPSTTFSIQNKDAGSGGYYSIITSAAITADATPTPIAAGLGVATTANVGAGTPIGTTWRVSATFAGSATPISTGTIACVVSN